jgi:hypothetical protein
MLQGFIRLHAKMTGLAVPCGDQSSDNAKMRYQRTIMDNVRRQILESNESFEQIPR